MLVFGGVEGIRDTRCAPGVTRIYTGTCNGLISDFRCCADWLANEGEEFERKAGFLSGGSLESAE